MPVRRMRPHGIKVFAKLSSESGWKAGETMRTAEWKDYELIDTADGERLERWGDVLLIRPDPQIIWSGEKKDPRWRNADARYRRSNSGGGKW